jgi:hypothetical protein
MYINGFHIFNLIQDNRHTKSRKKNFSHAQVEQTKENYSGYTSGQVRFILYR